MDIDSINKCFVEYILNLVGPSSQQNKSRESKLGIIRKVIQDTLDKDVELNLETRVFCFGSYPTQTYLPDSDLDITVMLVDKQTKHPFTSYSYEMFNL